VKRSPKIAKLLASIIRQYLTIDLFAIDKRRSYILIFVRHYSTEIRQTLLTKIEIVPALSHRNIYSFAHFLRSTSRIQQ